MPSPNAVDPWFAGRRFGIVIDAGSSGSRLQIYSWKDPRLVDLKHDDHLAHTLLNVDKGTRKGEEWVSKVEPGISSYADDPETVAKHLAPLLNHARDTVPPSLHAETSLFLLATAGMRLLTPERQAKLLLHTCHFLRHHSNFRIEESSDAGPCGTSVRIITGEEEGLFGWIAVNYLMDGFTGPSTNRTTYGFLDMGGASTQIAFEPAKQHQGDAKNLVDVRLRLLSGEEIHHNVFVTTWLGYGTNQARERYVGKAIRSFEATHTASADHKDADIVPDPCLPKDLQLTEIPVHSSPVSHHAQKKHTLRGTGSFEQCMQETASLLNKTAPCPDTPCLMNGVHVPPIDFSVSHFIGVSEYWYSSEHVFGLGGPYDFVQYERAASHFCSRDWISIVNEHKLSREQHRLGGDGEVAASDGQVVAVGKWGQDVELSRLEMQCFKAAWVANVLHEGIGMPRIVDPGGNATTQGDKVAAQADIKGLGRPTFQSVNSVGDIAISWTLGKMVLEASKEVPPRSKATPPLVDPIDDAPNANSPLKPIRPPFFDLGTFEDRLSAHLPTSLHRDSLGFSPVLFLIYTMLVVMIVLLGYRVRRQVRTPCLRFIGRFTRDTQHAYAMEEGKYSSGFGEVPGPPSSKSKWFSPVRRAFGAPSRPPPIRSQSMPDDLAQALAISVSSTTYNNSMVVSRTPSPAPGQLDPSQSLNSLSRLSGNVRSRNASSMNLSALGTRQHD